MWPKAGQSVCCVYWVVLDVRWRITSKNMFCLTVLFACTLYSRPACCFSLSSAHLGRSSLLLMYIPDVFLFSFFIFFPLRSSHLALSAHPGPAAAASACCSCRSSGAHCSQPGTGQAHKPRHPCCPASCCRCPASKPFIRRGCKSLTIN